MTVEVAWTHAFRHRSLRKKVKERTKGRRHILSVASGGDILSSIITRARTQNEDNACLTAKTHTCFSCATTRTSKHFFVLKRADPHAHQKKQNSETLVFGKTALVSFETNRHKQDIPAREQIATCERRVEPSTEIRVHSLLVFGRILTYIRVIKESAVLDGRVWVFTPSTVYSPRELCTNINNFFFRNKLAPNETRDSPKAHDGEVPEHVREEQQHDGRVHQLVQERPEERCAPVVTVTVRDHAHPKHRAPPEDEANRDQDIERVNQKLQRRRQNNPDLFIY